MAFYKRKGRFARKPRRVYKRKPRVARGVNVRSVVKKELNRLAIKPETKRQDVTYMTTDATIGQVAGNANAYYASEITPLIAPGTGVNQRIGNKISIKSLYITIQLRQMSAVSHPTKVKFFLFYDNTSNTDTPSNIVDDLFNTNEYIGGGAAIWDYNSTRNLDYMTDMQLVRQWTSYVRADSVSGQLNSKTYGIGCKFKKPKNITWYSTGSSNNAVGRFYLMAFCDSGNASTATASTLANVPVTAINSGLYFNHNVRWYYTDC